MGLPGFRVRRVRVREGMTLGYWREGEGGYPLLLVHGFPETKRIWARNVEPLARAGFDVIAPDLRGVGDSDLARDGFYDPAAYARDLHALLHDALGVRRCAAAAGDVGGVVLLDLGLRFPGFVERQCFFNSEPPLLEAAYRAAGIPPDPPRSALAQFDYFVRQGPTATASPPSATRPSGAAPTWPPCTGTGSGPGPAPSRPRRSPT